jgi:hypothetical protein
MLASPAVTRSQKRKPVWADSTAEPAAAAAAETTEVIATSPRSSDGGLTAKQTPADNEPPTKKRWGGRVKGAQKFNELDERRFLRILEEILPIGGDMWEEVCMCMRGGRLVCGLVNYQVANCVSARLRASTIFAPRMQGESNATPNF